MTEEEFFIIHGRQWEEWCTIRDELIGQWEEAGRPEGKEVTAHKITTEQRKRLLARGERMVSLDDIDALSPQEQICDVCGGFGNTEGIPLPGGAWVDCPKCAPQKE